MLNYLIQFAISLVHNLAISVDLAIHLEEVT